MTTDDGTDGVALPRLSPIELVSGVLLGLDRGAPRLTPDPTTTPRAAFETVLLRALRQAPCGITFSGGRDSSANLALATHLARREGLPLPVPITIRWRGVAEADETAWQTDLVKHLGLTDWVIDDVDAELDFVGPIAQEVLRRVGSYYPCHYHAFFHLSRHVVGGSLVTGHGGDGLLVGWRWRHLHHADGDRATTRALRVAHALAPQGVRRAVAHRREDAQWPWLAEEIDRGLSRQRNLEIATEPRRWASRVDWLSRRRNLRHASATLAAMGRLHDVQVSDPFSDNGFRAAMAAWHPVRGPGTRTEVMQALFGDVLPDPLVRRADKAIMTRGYLREHTRQFALDWDGTGFDPALVTAPEALRQTWLGTNAMAPLPLQVAWLHAQGLSPSASS